MFWGGNSDLSQKLQAISDATGHASTQTTLSSYFHMADVLGAAYLAQQEIEMPIKVLSNMLNMSEQVLYKRRSRADNEPLIKNALTAEKIHTLFSNPLSDVTIIKRLPNWPTSEVSIVEQNISLQLIDRLLLLVSRRQGNTTQLGVSVGISQEKIDNILSRAVKIELDSGFDFYKSFFACNDAFIKKPVSTKSNENATESKRLSALFKKIEPYRNEQMALTITAWKTAYSPKQNGWRFSSLAELFNFIEGLTLLGIGNSSFELLIPQTIILPEDIIERLSSLCQITTIDAPPNLTNHAKLQYITLKVDKLPKEWKTTQTLNRMLFCLAVRFELDLEKS